MKKDDSLTKVMLEPPKQRMRIALFDLRTQEEAFTVSLEGLKGVRSLLSFPITNLNFIASVEYQHSCLRIGPGPGRPKKKSTFALPCVNITDQYYLNPSSISPSFPSTNQSTERAQKTREITSTASWAST